jgi:hypothetical protein
MTWRFLDWTARRFHLAMQFQVEPRDLWVGVFWRFDRYKATITGWDCHHGAISGEPWNLHLYVCLVPCLPLHVYLLRTLRPA